MMKLKYYFTCCVLSVFLLTANSLFGEGRQISSSIVYHPYRYQRLFLFFFSEDATEAFAKNVMEKLYSFDDYCGGQDLTSTIFYNDSLHSSCEICYMNHSFENYSVEEMYYLNYTIAWSISSGSIDQEDVNNVTQKLLHAVRMLDWDAGSATNNKVSQVIVVTDYATDSLRNESENKSSILAELKSQKNITFIALTTNLTSEKANNYFPNNLWNVFNEYLNWTPDSGMNPICGYEAQNYTTPIPQFTHDLNFNIYLFFSLEYVKRTELVDVVSLLTNLTVRRWSNTCSQYRDVYFNINYLTTCGGNDCINPFTCAAEDLSFFNNTRYNGTFNQKYKICSVNLINQHIAQSAVMANIDVGRTSTCIPLFTNIFNFYNLEKMKTLLITDVQMPCTSTLFAAETFNMLKNYTFFKSGAPFTVIAIDNTKNSTVYHSYKPFFPPTQLPNLIRVNNIAEIFSNINTTVNFCLDTAPMLEYHEVPLGKIALPYQMVIWYFILIGACIFAAICVIFVILLLKRKRKRNLVLRELRLRTEINPGRVEHMNYYGQTLPNSAIKDIWEVSMELLDIDYINLIGRGAFSVVYSGFLHGKAPVLEIFPVIALQQFADCEVAIKTLPQHSTDNDRAKFQSEIELMKDIGYHVHLISMLGCNCSIERPILLMELAQQDLLHWLTSKNSTISIETVTDEFETGLDKNLLSISWQISDGMSYLSSKHLVHRDLAARNVLLNSEMKAMVSDFGMCQKCDDGEEILVNAGGKLPLKWMALESLQEQKFSFKTDIWSFGILLFEIFSLGKEPYEEIATQKLTAFLLEGKRLNKPIQANNQTYNLMRQCWKAEPSERPEFSSIRSYLSALLEDSAVNYGYLTAIEEENVQ